MGKNGVYTKKKMKEDDQTKRLREHIEEVLKLLSQIEGRQKAVSTTKLIKSHSPSFLSGKEFYR